VRSADLSALPGEQRKPALDGLRGIAALSVALGHCVLQVTGLALWGTSLRDFPSMPVSDILNRVASALFPSDAAVLVFFVLSGHVLWESFRRKNSRFVAGLPDYVCARAYRLFPLTIAAAIPLGYFVSAPAADLVRNMLLLSRNLNGVLWSLQVEVIASLALFALWGLTRGKGWKLAAALVLSLGLGRLFRGNMYVAFFPAFIMGAAISSIPAAWLRNRWVVAAGLALLVLSNIVFGHNGARVYEMAGAVVIVGAAGAGRFAFLRSRAVLFLGTISYPFYLTHPIGLNGAAWVLPMLPLASTWPNIAARAVVSIGLTIPLALALHVLVEVPVLRGRPRLGWPFRWEAGGVVLRLIGGSRMAIGRLLQRPGYPRRPAAVSDSSARQPGARLTHQSR
jgi:peptidoglycan/LPS O-acetylase OafA/YrhL